MAHAAEYRASAVTRCSCYSVFYLCFRVEKGVRPPPPLSNQRLVQTVFCAVLHDLQVQCAVLLYCKLELTPSPPQMHLLF